MNDLGKETENLPLVMNFWDSTPQLSHIHVRAESLLISPWALLAATLANAASHIPPQITAPDGGTMNLLVGITGRPGSGFSTTIRASEELVRPLGKISGIPTLKFCLEELWSGGQRYNFPSASLTLDNALGLPQLFHRQGTAARRRTLDLLDGNRIPLPNGEVFDKGAYRLNLRESLYPGHNAKWLFEEKQRADHVAERYLIAPLWVRRPVPLAPTTLAPELPDWSLAPDGAVRAASGFVDPEDPGLPLRNRVSVALASLHGQTEVDEHFWELADAPVRISAWVSSEMSGAQRSATTPDS